MVCGAGYIHGVATGAEMRYFLIAAEDLPIQPPHTNVFMIEELEESDMELIADDLEYVHQRGLSATIVGRVALHQDYLDRLYGIIHAVKRVLSAAR